jgi:hypothetical protein
MTAGISGANSRFQQSDPRSRNHLGQDLTALTALTALTDLTDSFAGLVWLAFPRASGPFNWCQAQIPARGLGLASILNSTLRSGPLIGARHT